jgi:hypothetical protein
MRHPQFTIHNALKMLYDTPCYIPAGYLEFNSFPTPATDAGLQSTLNTSFANVKDIYVMFPRRPNEVTCF